MASFSGVKTEDATQAQHPEDDPTDAAYAAAFRVLEHAHRDLSAARARPRPPMISVTSAERHYNGLRAEIQALTHANTRDRVTIQQLRADVVAASKDRDGYQIQLQARDREIASLKEAQVELRLQLEALQASTAAEREDLKTGVDRYNKGVEELNLARSAFEAEREAVQKSMAEERKSITDNLQRVIQAIQGGDATATAQSTTVAVSPIIPVPLLTQPPTKPSLYERLALDDDSDEARKHARSPSRNNSSPSRRSRSPLRRSRSRSWRSPSPSRPLRRSR
ncbi:hypothetical protein C8R43DRAFT_991281, partial [Mycena crocata]